MEWRRSPYFRPVLCIVLVLGALFLSVTALSRPASVWAVLEARCEAVILPVTSEWSFPAPDSLSAFWAQAQIKNVEQLTINGNPDHRTTVDLFIREASASKPPSFFLEPGVHRTELTVSAAPGTRLAVSRASPPRLEWRHSPAGSWSARLSFFEARFESSNLGGGGSLNGRIQNKTIPATLALSSSSAPQRQLPAYLSVPAPAALTWSLPSGELARFTSLSGSGCRLSALRSEPAGPANSSGQAEEMEAHWRSLRAISISWEGSGTGPSLRVIANGELSSLREAGRQLLPTTFEQLARGAPEQRGLLGVFSALLVLAAGVYLKRAIDILAKLHLPEPK